MLWFVLVIPGMASRVHVYFLFECRWWNAEIKCLWAGSSFTILPGIRSTAAARRRAEDWATLFSINSW